MKNRLLIVIIFLSILITGLAKFTFAEVPKTIAYQGYLTTSTGTPVNTLPQIMFFYLYDTATGGTALWSETQTVTISSGVYNVTLGSVTPISIAFDKQYYLGIKVGTDSEMTPRMALATVGYAFMSKRVEIDPTPAGGIIAFGGITAPTGWLLCYGSAVSRTTYAALFAAIGTAHGSGGY